MQKYKEAILYIIFIVIAIVFVVSKIQPKLVELINVEKDLHAKNIEISDLDRKVETLKASELKKDMQIQSLNKKIYKPGETGVDAEASFTIPFDDVIEMAKYNNIKIYSIGYVYNPASDEFVKGAPGKYNVCELTMQLIADYADLGSFLKELYKYPYLINMEKLEIIPYQKNKKILLINLQLKLYSEI